MIKYKNILEKLKSAGYNTGVLRKEKILAESTISRIRNNQPVKIEILDLICQILDCGLDDIVEIIPDEKGNKIKGGIDDHGTV